MTGNRLQNLPTSRFWWLGAGASAAAGIAVGMFGQLVPNSLSAQFQLNLSLNAAGNDVLDTIAHTAGEVYSPPFAIAITILTSALIWLFTRSKLDAIAFAVITAAGWLPAQFFKFFIDEKRPDQLLLSHSVVSPETDNAFPSGHTCFAISFGYALYLLLRSQKAKTWVLGLWILSVLVMAWARVYSGVHYPTDILGSVFASLAGLFTIGFVWNQAVKLLQRKAAE